MTAIVLMHSDDDDDSTCCRLRSALPEPRTKRDWKAVEDPTNNKERKAIRQIMVKRKEKRKYVFVVLCCWFRDDYLFDDDSKNRLEATIKAPIDRIMEKDLSHDTSTESAGLQINGS